MAEAKAKRYTRRNTNPEVSTLQRIGIDVVDALSLRVELVEEEVVVEDLVRARNRGISVRRGEGSTISAEVEHRLQAGAGSGPKLHNASHGIGPVNRTFGSAHQFQALDVVHWSDAEVVK